MIVFPSWKIKSLEEVESELRSPEEVAAAMRPLGSSAYRCEDSNLWCGQTAWGWKESGRTCAIGWDWTEIMPGVPVLSDPMNITSNVALFGESEGRKTCFSASATLALNGIIFLLPWQIDVLKEVPKASYRRKEALASARAMRVAPTDLVDRFRYVSGAHKVLGSL